MISVPAVKVTGKKIDGSCKLSSIKILMSVKRGTYGNTCKSYYLK